MAKATDYKDSDALVKVILYKSKTLADGSHPLMVRITKDRQRKYVSTGLSLQLKHWDDKKAEPRRNCPDRLLVEASINKWKAKFTEAASDLKQEEKPFSALRVAAKAAKSVRKVSVLGFIDEYNDRLNKEKRMGTASTVRDIRRALVRYETDEGRSPEKLLFTEVTPGYLDDFRSTLAERGLAETSMAVYFRTLRLVYNQAIKRGLVHDKHYPFREFKVSQFDLRTRKRAISKEEIGRIVDLKPETARLQLARDLFVFSYYGAGINFVDMAYLTWNDVQNGRLRYERKKTGHLFNFKLSVIAQQILDYYRPLTYKGIDAYVFPILDRHRHQTPKQVDNRIHKILGQVNPDLKVIAQMAGVEVVLTTYVARHSFATALKYSGVATAVISEAMGHQTESITQTYLASFENELIDEAFDNL
ncbi:site-specific integrase [Spirosoma sp. BT702]|uniref:Site-specific integrase n=1 Tax=Spirosoma profusum TaxID=2771354 RepID=A0A927GAT1_9BACT|nr:site-specific integrase [Spirosoma profusum]MBD2705370.1 site-specific integrase [Spirosoma profusum]